MNPEQNEQFSQLVEDVAAVKKAVIGDEAYGQVGLVHRVTALEAWRGKVMIQIAAVSGAAAVIYGAIKLFH